MICVNWVNWPFNIKKEADEEQKVKLQTCLTPSGGSERPQQEPTPKLLQSLKSSQNAVQKESVTSWMNARWEWTTIHNIKSCRCPDNQPECPLCSVWHRVHVSFILLGVFLFQRIRSGWSVQSTSSPSDTEAADCWSSLLKADWRIVAI